LFFGVAIHPGIAIVQSKKNIIDVEPKDYLFKTIIDISNNPDVEDLINKYEKDLFSIDIDMGTYKKIFISNPRLFRSLFLLKTSVTFENLENLYTQGLEIINIISKEKAIEIIESAEFKDIELFYEIKEIVSNDVELSNRLVTIKEINSEMDCNLDIPNICSILCIMLFIPCIYGSIIATLTELFVSIGFSNIPIILWAILVTPALLIIAPIFAIFLLLCLPWLFGWDGPENSVTL
jgi:hypothetical protein